MIVALSRAAAFTAAALILVYGVLFTETHSDLMWLLMLAISAVLLMYAIVPRLGREIPHVNGTIVTIGAVFVVGFLLISVQLVRIQVVESAEIAGRSASDAGGAVVIDPRTQIRDAEIARGRILTRDGETVAGTDARAGGGFSRTYPNPHLGYVAGYYSPLVFGSTQLESRYDEVLMGREGGNPFEEWLDQVLHRTRHGYDLILSIDGELQRLGYDLLGDRRGAVIVMDAQTGELYAMVSKPHIDPNRLFAGLGPSSSEEIAAAIDYWQEINQSEGSPLLLRPTQGLYAPGSVFKTITAASALESGVSTPSEVFRNEGAITIDSHVIIEQNLPDENRVSYTLEESYGYSLNVVFAQLGIRLGQHRLAETARQFGFEASIPFDMGVAVSRIANNPEYLENEVGVAETAFGQGQLFVTPMLMALMTQAVVNDGNMSQPFIVDEVRDREGQTLQQTRPSTWRQAMDPDVAAQMQDIMISSVQSGWATDAQIPGAVVGGKTGTAEVGDQTPHAWFVGFAGRDEPRYVVAVVVEHGGSGGAVALPIAREMLTLAMDRLD